MAVDVQLVRTLRDQTGAGIMDCKEALEKSGGDMEKAIQALREKGVASAGKRVGLDVVKTEWVKAMLIDSARRFVESS